MASMLDSDYPSSLTVQFDFDPLPSPATPEPYDDPAYKECSVRGCHQLVPANATAKMCDTCRGRHRVYATTKRMKRKMEKATLQSIVGQYAQQKKDGAKQAGEGLVVTESGWPGSIGQNISTVGLHAHEWDPTIDPRLYDPNMDANPHVAYAISSRSSELANALDFPSLDTTPYIYLDPTSRVPDTPAFEAPHQSQATPANQDSAPLPTADPSTPTQSVGDGLPARFCSVKGCKAVIPGSYEFKMCPSCRTRYRGYGITKRRKWKAEREAFSVELNSLRVDEDNRRKDKGLPPLADNPDELRSWEMSVLDEQIPLPPDVMQALEAAGIRSDGTMAIPSALDDQSEDLLDHFSKVAEKVGTLTEGGSTSAIAKIPTLSARMCTVSHCHKILPGYYRYKRCEQHRLQNRHHSKLKRVREKVVKALGPEDGLQVIEINPALHSKDDGPPAQNEEREDKLEGDEDAEGEEEGEKEAEGSEDQCSGLDPLNTPADPAADAGDAPQEVTEKGSVRSGKIKRRPSSCVTEDCQNLLQLEKRWKHCDVCRLTERRKKAHERASQAASPQDGTADLQDKAIDPSILPNPATTTRQQNDDRAGNAASPFPIRQMSTVSSAIDVQHPSDNTSRGEDNRVSGIASEQPDSEGDTVAEGAESNNTNGQQQEGPRPPNVRTNRNDGTLRMVNLTPQTYEHNLNISNEGPVRWSITTVTDQSFPSGPPNGTNPVVGTATSFELNRNVSTTPPTNLSSNHDQPAPTTTSRPTLTIKEYRPPVVPTSSGPPETSLTKFLAQHPYVTVETFEGFLDHASGKDVAGKVNSGGGDHLSDASSNPRGGQEDAISEVSASISGGSSTGGSVATTMATEAQRPIAGSQPPSTVGTARVDIPRVATSTSESFRYYTGPAEAQTRSGGGGSERSAAHPPEFAPCTAVDAGAKRKLDNGQQPPPPLGQAMPTPTNVPVNAQPAPPYYPYGQPYGSYGYYPASVAGSGHYPYGVTMPSYPPQPQIHPGWGVGGPPPVQVQGYPYAYTPPVVQVPYGYRHYPNQTPAFVRPPAVSSPASSVPFPYNTYLPVTSHGAPPGQPPTQPPHGTHPPPAHMGAPRPRYYSEASATIPIQRGRSSSMTRQGVAFSYYRPQQSGTDVSVTVSQEPPAPKRKRLSIDPGSLEKQGTESQDGTPSIVNPSPSDASSQTTTDGNSPDATGPASAMLEQRTCRNKNCHRQLPAHSSGLVCDRCKNKIKKHQEKAKAKFKLVPFKSIVDHIGAREATNSAQTSPSPSVTIEIAAHA